MTLVILFSLKLMETLENRLQTHSGASLQSCRSIDADAWCKWALTGSEGLFMFLRLCVLFPPLLNVLLPAATKLWPRLCF